MEKKAIVMGASSGIGLEVAKELLRRGWTVGVAARNTEPLERLKSWQETSQPDRDATQVYVSQIDVTDDDAPQRLLQLVEDMGGMDLYFHAAGIGKQNTALRQDIELKTVATNGLGFTQMVTTAYTYFCQKGAHKERHNRDIGHIAVISSIAGTKGLGPAPAYSATKALQSTYIEALEQLANGRHLPIRFTDFRPGFVDTPLLHDGNHYPLMLRSDKVAHDMVDSIEKGRHVRVIDWRWRIITWAWRRMPRWMWRRLLKVGALC